MRRGKTLRKRIFKKSKTTTTATTTKMNIGMTNLGYWSKSVGFKIFETNVKLFFQITLLLDLCMLSAVDF